MAAHTLTGHPCLRVITSRHHLGRAKAQEDGQAQALADEGWTGEKRKLVAGEDAGLYTKT